MPSFDVVSELDMQEVRNAVDQARREIGTRFDFKSTGVVDRPRREDDRPRHRERRPAQGADPGARGEARAPAGVVEGVVSGKVEEASKGTVRQTVTLNMGISSDKACEIGKFLKGLSLKGVQHQVQGDQLRVTGKKRDDLQAAIQAMRDARLRIALQFTNFHD